MDNEREIDKSFRWLIVIVLIALCFMSFVTFGFLGGLGTTILIGILFFSVAGFENIDGSKMGIIHDKLFGGMDEERGIARFLLLSPGFCPCLFKWEVKEIEIPMHDFTVDIDIDIELVDRQSHVQGGQIRIRATIKIQPLSGEHLIDFMRLSTGYPHEREVAARNFVKSSISRIINDTLILFSLKEMTGNKEAANAVLRYVTERDSTIEDLDKHLRAILKDEDGSNDGEDLYKKITSPKNQDRFDEIKKAQIKECQNSGIKIRLFTLGDIEEPASVKASRDAIAVMRNLRDAAAGDMGYKDYADLSEKLKACKDSPDPTEQNKYNELMARLESSIKDRYQVETGIVKRSVESRIFNVGKETLDELSPIFQKILEQVLLGKK